MLRKSVALVGIVVAILALAACKDLKTPAEQAMSSVQQALDAIAGPAGIYAPEELAKVRSSVSALQDALAKKEYQKVIDGKAGAMAQIEALTAAVDESRARYAADWEAMSAGLTNVVETIAGRIDILSQSKKLPSGLTAESFAGAQQTFSDMKSTWSAANEAAAAGNMVDAVSKGNQVKGMARDVMTTLGMEVPPALQG